MDKIRSGKTLMLVLASCLFSSGLAASAADSPSDTYLEYLSTIAKTDSWAEAHKFDLEPPTPVKPVDGSIEKSEHMALATLKYLSPKSAKVISEKIDGNKARLVIEGVSNSPVPGGPDRPCTGKIDLVKVGDSWKIALSDLDATGSGPAPLYNGTPQGVQEGMAQGKIDLKLCSVVSAQINAKHLVMQLVSPHIGLERFTVRLDFQKPITIENKSYTGSSMIGGSHCTVSLKSDVSSFGWSVSSGYSLALKFYAPKGHQLPCYIDLRTPAKGGLALKGFFYASR